MTSVMPGLFGVPIFDGLDQTQYRFSRLGKRDRVLVVGIFMVIRNTGTVSSVFRGSETTDCLVVVLISDVGGSSAEMWHLLGSEGFAIFTGQLIIRRPTGLILCNFFLGSADANQ